jgi:hypothetical protein
MRINVNIIQKDYFLGLLKDTFVLDVATVEKHGKNHSRKSIQRNLNKKKGRCNMIETVMTFEHLGQRVKLLKDSENCWAVVHESKMTFFEEWQSIAVDVFFQICQRMRDRIAEA